MKDLMKKHLVRAVTFGLVMTIIEYITDGPAFTPVWVDLLIRFSLCTAIYLGINVLYDWISGKIKKG